MARVASTVIAWPSVPVGSAEELGFVKPIEVEAGQLVADPERCCVNSTADRLVPDGHHGRRNRALAASSSSDSNINPHSYKT